MLAPASPLQYILITFPMNNKLVSNILRSRPATVLIAGALFISVFWGVDTLIGSHPLPGGASHPQLLLAESEEFWVRLATSFLMAAYAIYVWLVVRHRDGLEKELAQALGQARDEQAKSEAIIAAIADGVSIQDLDFRVLVQNKVHQDLVGGDRRGEFCYQAYADGEGICPACPVADALFDGQVHRLEKPGNPSSGAEFIEITASPVRNAKGEIIGGLEIVRDITERKWTEESIKQQTLFFQQLIDTIPSPIFYKNTQGIFLGCNTAFATCIGRSRAEVVGRTLFEIIPGAMAVMYAGKDDELIANPGTQIYESYVQCNASGDKREVIFYKATFNDHDGEVAGLVGVVIDIADRIAAERSILALNSDLARQAAELAAANRELEAYNYSFTHDLRNNLTRISSASQILIDMYGEQLEESAKLLLEGNIAAATQIHELSEAMQMLFSVTRRDVLHQSVNLSELATAIAMDLRLAGLDRVVTFIIQPDLQVHADPRLMKVLLENLLGNAWKYSAQKAESFIELGMLWQGEEPRYYVRDNGVGFPPEQSTKLFAPFIRLHRAQEFPGSGIGLATVQRIVQRHGGKIWAEGDVGQGATFWFTLPAGTNSNIQGEQ